MNDLIYRIVGQNVRQQRLLKGWTQEQLANKTKLTRSSMANIETGRQRTQIEVIYYICFALQCELRDIFPDSIEDAKVKQDEDLRKLESLREELEKVNERKAFLEGQISAIAQTYSHEFAQCSNCSSPAVQKGMCLSCYHASVYTPVVKHKRMYEGVICSKCSNPAAVKGMCPRCYQRIRNGYKVEGNKVGREKSATPVGTPSTATDCEKP
ncbi:transcriptional regulator with XRE-family HTH domain [Paenibacillus phyllosphaerae]|uniref:Transcriptional regulator with XRE-family HTH domain n=1 Tax=Paenibacillus phyllosphaerae TaxID=274593 RepID=A0A7W5AVW0_9BACL|nr:helix-turn-helix transcriptional regulator [Paenibacillus phyllosphaerae]MBB3109116.1 transcriptional regulator with XRE-family HTH domain [Paenibacillus phyllosphaerae]